MTATEAQKRNRFVSSTIEWISADKPETGTVEQIVDRLQEISDASPLPPRSTASSTTPDAPVAATAPAPSTPGICGPLGWRIEEVTDFRNKTVPPAGERLMRWEISPHQEVFDKGIISFIERKSRDDPSLAVSNVNDLQGKIADLRNYVRNGDRSVFVSTSRTWTDRVTGQIKRIVPKHEQVISRHEYEIFVHGGIDVTWSGESGHNFVDVDEREIAFTGGIRREFIRSVRTYPKVEGINGVPEVWENPYFNPSANGQGVTVKLADLPAIVDLGSGVEVKTWIPPAPGQATTVPITVAPLPALDWRPEGDPLATRERVPMTRAAFTTSDGSQVWFANNTLVITKNEHETPPPPVSIAEHWPGVLQVGFARIDAILSTPGLSEKHRLFVFREKQCAQIKEENGDVVDGPAIISKVWPALGQANFSEIDAVLPYPAPSETVAFFRKTRYALVRFNAEKGSAHGELIESGEYATRWPAIAEFPYLDAVLVDRIDKSQVNFACGPKFISTDIEVKLAGAAAAEGTWAGAEAAPEEPAERAEEGIERRLAERSRWSSRGAHGRALFVRHEAPRVSIPMYEGHDEGVVSRGGYGVPRGEPRYGQQQMIAEKWTALGNAGFY